VRLAAGVIALLLLAPFAIAQDSYGPSPDAPAVTSRDATPIELPGAGGFSRDAMNPIRVVGDAAQALGGGDDERPGLSAALNIMILLTVLTLAPSIMLMCTCFLRILIVLGLLKQAMGTNSLPPSQVVTGLALFMTLVVMSPTIDRIWDEAVVPYNNGEIRDYDELWTRAKQPLRDFMFDQLEVTGNWSSLYMVLEHRGIDVSDPSKLTRADVDMVSLVPAYMISELKVAFLMGFRVYLPFLVIDMVIASMLISMSMMMLPPVLISLPFKLMLFVMVDGWALIVGNLMGSFERGGAATAMISPEHYHALATINDHVAMVLPALG